MVYNPKNTGSMTSDGSIGRKCQKIIKIRKKNYFFGLFYVSHDPPRTNLAKQKRTIDSTDGVQSEKHRFSNFWRFNREEMWIFWTFFKSPTTPLWKIFWKKSVQTIVQMVYFQKKYGFKNFWRLNEKWTKKKFEAWERKKNQKKKKKKGHELSLL